MPWVLENIPPHRFTSCQKTISLKFWEMLQSCFSLRRQSHRDEGFIFGKCLNREMAVLCGSPCLLFEALGVRICRSSESCCRQSLAFYLIAEKIEKCEFDIGLCLSLRGVYHAEGGGTLLVKIDNEWLYVIMDASFSVTESNELFDKLSTLVNIVVCSRSSSASSSSIEWLLGLCQNFRHF